MAKLEAVGAVNAARVGVGRAVVAATAEVLAVGVLDLNGVELDEACVVRDGARPGAPPPVTCGLSGVCVVLALDAPVC